MMQLPWFSRIVMLLVLVFLAPGLEVGAQEISEIRAYLELRDAIRMVQMDIRDALTPSVPSRFRENPSGERDLADALTYLEEQVVRFGRRESPLSHYYEERLNALLWESKDQFRRFVAFQALRLPTAHRPFSRDESARHGGRTPNGPVFPPARVEVHSLQAEPPAVSPEVPLKRTPEKFLGGGVDNQAHTFRVEPPDAALARRRRAYFSPIGLRTVLMTKVPVAPEIGRISRTLEHQPESKPESKPEPISILQPKPEARPETSSDPAVIPEIVPQKFEIAPDLPVVAVPSTNIGAPATIPSAGGTHPPASPDPSAGGDYRVAQPDPSRATDILSLLPPVPAAAEASATVQAGAVTATGSSPLFPTRYQALKPFPGKDPQIHERPGMRPLAVMIENHRHARPQTGLEEAEVVYEIPVEGGITRFMALYYHVPGILGPVRSCRDYFIDRALEVNALYVHCGGSPQGYEYIGKTKVFAIDEISNGKPFFRDNNRKAPHNLYTTAKSLINEMNRKYPMQLPYLRVPLRYGPRPTAGTRLNQGLHIRYHGNYQVKYRFNAAQNVYERSMNDEPHVDRKSLRRIAPGTVVLQLANMKVIDSQGRQDIDFIGRGRGFLLHGGTVRPIFWQKTVPRDFTRFFDEQNHPIHFDNRKPVWIQVVGPVEKYSFDPPLPAPETTATLPKTGGSVGAAPSGGQRPTTPSLTGGSGESAPSWRQLHTTPSQAVDTARNTVQGNPPVALGN